MPGKVHLENLLLECRQTLRGLTHSPGFALTVLATLSLAIGANTAIFSLLYAVLLRPLPVESPGELVEMLHQFPYPGEPRINGFPPEIYEHIQKNTRLLAATTVMSSPGFEGFSFRREGAEAERIRGIYVDGAYFSMLGLRAAIGRLLLPDDNAAGSTAAGAVAVLSWECWRNRFQEDPAIAGMQIEVEQVPVTIVGVAPRGFQGLDVGNPVDLWVPRALARQLQPGRQQGGGLVGRLRRGVSLESARAELELLYRQGWDPAALAVDPARRRTRFFVESARNGIGMARDRFRTPLLLMMGSVALLLLLACTNLASMLAARSESRQHHSAVRSALGCGPLRLLWRPVTESAALAIAGAAGGLLVAWSGANAIAMLASSARLHERVAFTISLDGTVLLFTASLAVMASLLFGVAPALRLLRLEPAALLRSGNRSEPRRNETWLGRGLVSAQVAMSIVLLSAAILFARHLFELRNVGVGFDPSQLLIVTLDPAGAGENNANRSLAYQALIARVGTIPGIEAAALSGATPISGAAASRFVRAVGFEEDDARRRRANLNWVSPDYFLTYRTPILSGRAFTEDDLGSRPVVVVNQSFASHYFRGTNPIGGSIVLEGADTQYEIIGMAADAKYTELRAEAPRTGYLLAFQRDRVIGNELSIRSALSREQILSRLRDVIQETTPGVRISKTTTMSAQMDSSLVPERLLALLSRLFGSMAMLLTAIGLFGLLQYQVARRVREIGIRMALGATRRDAAWLAIREMLLLSFVGIAAGVVAAVWMEHLVPSLLEGAPPLDDLSIALSVILVFSMAWAAAALPAWRAASLHPASCLREE